MTYFYECDGFCDGTEHDGRPALTGEFNDDWYADSAYGDQLRQMGYEPENLVTLCPSCVGELLLEHGT